MGGYTQATGQAGKPANWAVGIYQYDNEEEHSRTGEEQRSTAPRKEREESTNASHERGANDAAPPGGRAAPLTPAAGRLGH